MHTFISLIYYLKAYVGRSKNNFVNNNTCNSNGFGVYFEYSDLNSMIENTCVSNQYGIYLDSSDTI
ncbi:MAG: NosD domain-containing protein [Candidatus Kariarchaeaceae archaeon]